jgi:hypothetical protein
MESLLNHPAVQSAVIPLVVSLVVLLLAIKTKPVLGGLAAIAAFAATVSLATGFTFSPLTSTRKIVLIALIAAGVGLVADVSRVKWSNRENYLHAALAVLSVAAVLWVIWPVLSRGPTTAQIWLTGAGLSLYVAWMVLGVSVLQENKERLSAALLTLALGTSVVAILGASALYGQLAAPFAAAIGAWMLLSLVIQFKESFPVSFYFSAVLVCALLGAAATVYADLPWLTLVILALVPLLVRVPVKQATAQWLQMAIAAVAGFVPVAAAIWYTMRQSAESGYYG